MRFKLTILFLLFAAMLLPLYAQNLPRLPLSGKEVEDFVPAGWKITKQLDGDLDREGTAESVLVLQGTDQALIKTQNVFDFNLLVNDENTGSLKLQADNNPVILAVLSKVRDGYKLTAQNNQLVPPFEDGWYRWKHSVGLEGNILRVELAGKISSGIRDNFGETRRVYKFQAQNSGLVLTEAEETFWFQAMLGGNGRKDRYRKYDFLKNKGFIVSTESFDNKAAIVELRKLESLMPFENAAADSIDAIAKIETVADKNFTAPTLTGAEISRKVLRLIKEIDGIEKLSPANFETNIGGKIVFDEENRARFGYAGKIAGSEWFYQIFTLSESSGEKPRSLEFGFQNPENDNAELLPVCEFGFEDYQKELILTGFSVKPFYGEHGRLLYWQFEKGNVELKIKTEKYERKECVRTLWINVLS